MLLNQKKILKSCNRRLDLTKIKIRSKYILNDFSVITLESTLNFNKYNCNFWKFNQKFF